MPLLLRDMVSWTIFCCFTSSIARISKCCWFKTVKLNTLMWKIVQEAFDSHLVQSLVPNTIMSYKICAFKMRRQINRRGWCKWPLVMIANMLFSRLEAMSIWTSIAKGWEENDVGSGWGTGTGVRAVRKCTDTSCTTPWIIGGERKYPSFSQLQKTLLLLLHFTTRSFGLAASCTAEHGVAWK